MEIVFPAHNRQTHCAHSHPYTEANTGWKINWKGLRCRECKECGRLRMQRKRENPDFKANEAAKTRRWRKANPEKYKASYTAVYEKKRKILDDARANGCVKCGESDLACLDFHHRNGLEDKLGNVGEIRKFSEKRILEELAKCDVLCANCHRKHHCNERKRQQLVA